MRASARDLGAIETCPSLHPLTSGSSMAVPREERHGGHEHRDAYPLRGGKRTEEAAIGVAPQKLQQEARRRIGKRPARHEFAPAPTSQEKPQQDKKQHQLHAGLHQLDGKARHAVGKPDGIVRVHHAPWPLHAIAAPAQKAPHPAESMEQRDAHREDVQMLEDAPAARTDEQASGHHRACKPSVEDRPAKARRQVHGPRHEPVIRLVRSQNLGDERGVRGAVKQRPAHDHACKRHEHDDDLVSGTSPRLRANSHVQSMSARMPAMTQRE